MFLPITNLSTFGWVFFFLYFGVPYLSPVLAIGAAISGSSNLLKAVGNLNSLECMVNIPLTLYACLIHDDDP